MAAVTLKSIRKSFGAHEVVHGVDISIADGEFCVLVGPSGCGKTTLLRAIAGLECHRDGFLKVGDMIWQAAERFVPPHRRPLGYVFQEASLFAHLSVRRNLEYGVKRVPEDQRRVALTQAIDLLGIGPLLERKPDRLSGGERQRVAIARALVGNPRIVLADEPTANLDHKTGEGILTLMKDINRKSGTTFIFSTHDPKIVSEVETVYTLEDGMLVDRSTEGEGRHA